MVIPLRRGSHRKGADMLRDILIVSATMDEKAHEIEILAENVSDERLTRLEEGRTDRYSEYERYVFDLTQVRQFKYFLYWIADQAPIKKLRKTQTSISYATALKSIVGIQTMISSRYRTYES